MPLKQKHKNQLCIFRKKIGLEQKQVAALLGHKTVNQISRYERGVALPGLKTAIKLGIIYCIPIQVLFYGFYKVCLDEIKKQQITRNKSEKDSALSNVNFSGDNEFCTFTEKLKPVYVKDADLDKVRSHIAELVHIRCKKMDHI